MKFLKNFCYAMLCMGVMTFALFSCSDDDGPKKPGGDPDPDSAIVYEAVDLGLPSGTEWATFNIGATKPGEFGDFFSWGETVTKSSYYFSDSEWYYKTASNELVNLGVIGTNNLLTAEYDAATKLWGEEWCMPTESDFDELISYCTWTWTTQDDNDGYKVTGPNGNSIFLPTAGAKVDNYDNYAPANGFYWLAEYDKVSSFGGNLAFALAFTDSSKNITSYGLANGLPIRPIKKTIDL